MVGGALFVEQFEMAPIEGQYGTLQGVGATQYPSIAGAVSTVLLCREHIMSPLTQEIHNGEGEILVGVKQHRGLLHEASFARFILGNGVIDFLAVGGSVLPRGLEIDRR